MILNVQPALPRLGRPASGEPVSILKGKVFLPASKSYSIRAWMIAACGGVSTLIHPSDCDDAKVAQSVAKALGATITSPKKNYYHLKANTQTEQLKKINVRESGTVLRLLLALLSLRRCQTTVVGEGTLVGRPNAQLLNTLRASGVHVKGTGPQESVPIYFDSTGQNEGMRSGTLVIDGSLSSQFISSLLIACPQLPAPTRLKITGRTLVSTDYIQMTLEVLKWAGVNVIQKSPREFTMSGGQRFKGLKQFKVPSDYGLAAFLMAAAALVPSNVTLEGVFDDRFIQADGRILTFLKAMGVRWQQTSQAIKIKGPFTLKAGTFSLKDCPDLVPIMAVLALFAKGVTRLKDIAHARAKESDRISDLRQELLKVGARVEETSSGLTIYPLSNPIPAVLLDPHHDHRLAMAFAVLGLKIGTRIQDIECVKKSYPGFVADLKKLQAPLDLD